MRERRGIGKEKMATANPMVNVFDHNVEPLDEHDDCGAIFELVSEEDDEPMNVNVEDDDASFFELLDDETNVRWLLDAWERVEVYLSSICYSGELDPVARSITMSPTVDTPDRDYIVKASYLTQLLAKTNLPPSLAIEIMLGLRHHVFISSGTEPGGPFSEYDIDKEEGDRRRKQLIASKKAIYELMCCTLYVTGNTVTVVGDTFMHVKIVEFLVDFCLRLGFHPLYVIRTMAVKIPDKIGGYQCIGWKFDLDPFLSQLVNGKAEPQEKFEPWSEELMLDEDPSFSFLISDKTAKILHEDRQMLESSLKEYGMTLTLDQVKGYLKVSTTSRDRHIMHKAWLIVELLATTNVPPSLAIKIMNGSVQHVLIATGRQEYGLCEIFGIDKEEFRKREECLLGSLEAIQNLTCCSIFVGDSTATAVGTPDGLEMFETIVGGCIAHNIPPSDMIAKIKHKESNEAVVKRPGEIDMLDVVTSFTQSFHKADEEKLKDAWPMVQLSLEEHGISCTLDGVNRTMTVSTTGATKDPDGISKARHLLELLATTYIPPSVAIEVMNGLRKYVFMKIGFQDGGLCSKFGIKKDEYIKRRARLEAYSQEIRELAGQCVFSLKEDTVAAVSGYIVSPGFQFELVRTLVESFIVYDG